MDLARVLQALKNADAAGDTTAAKQLAQMAQQMSQPAPAPESQLKPDYTTGEMLSKAVTRGAKQIGSAFGDVIPAMGAHALGFDEYAKQQMGEAAQTQEEINKYYAPQYQGTQDVHGLGSALGFGAETIAEQIPNIATSLIPGLGATGLAARAGLGMAGKAAAANVGSFLGAYAQNAPEIFQNVYDKTGKMDTGAAMIFGAGSAALDSVLPASLSKRLTAPVKASIVEKMLEKSGMNPGLLRTVTSGMIKGVPTEGLTEGAQEAISIAAENFVGNNPQIFGSPEWDRIMQSAIKGAVAGSGFGGVGGAVERGQAGAQRREEYAQALEKRGDRQAAAEVRRQSAEIEAMQGQEAQQTLPGFEMGPATGLMPPIESTEPTVKGPKGTQAEMFTAEGALTAGTEKAAVKDEKSAANRARQEEQQHAAQVKADEKALKDALAELTNTPKSMAALANLPTPLEQTINQTRGEMDALAEKRGPKTPLNAPLVTTQAMPAPEAGTVTEPTIRRAAEPLTIETAPVVIPTVHADLKAFGKMFGIGPTARLLKEDGPLAGKDITDPAQAAEVKTVLEAYASGNPAVGAADKIEAYLKRPEFQGAQNVAGPNVEPVGTSTPVAIEPSAVGATGAVAEPERGGVVPTGETTEYPTAGTEKQPRALTERIGLPEGPAHPNAVHDRLDIDDAVLLKQMIVKTVEDGLASGKTRQQIAQQLEALTKGGIKESDFSRIHDYLTERGVKETPQKPATTTAPDVDSIKSFPVGPSRITPAVIARDKPTYTETNVAGLEDLARYDKQFEYSGAFVSDNPDLALGQGTNTGVFIEFRPNSISGQVHAKLGTSPATGQEYKSDVVAPKAINVVTVKNPARFKPGPMATRLLRAEFDKVTLPDGSVQYTRKGVTATKTLPITQAAETTAPVVGKKATSDLKKAAQGRVEAKQEQNAFIAENDQRVDDILTGRLHEMGKDVGVPARKIPVESHRGTEAHNMLRLPGLFNEFFRLQEVMAKAQEPNQKAKNEQSLQQVIDTVAKTDPNALEMLTALRQMPGSQRDKMLSQINKQGMNAFEQSAKPKIAAVKQDITASRTEPEVQQEIKPVAVSEDEIYARLQAAFNNSKVGQAFQQLGSKLFSPKFVGPSFDDAQKKLAEQGNVNGLLSSLIQTAKGAEIQKVLRKLRSLNLNVKLEIGPVEGGKVGSYDPATNTITLDPTHGMNAHTVLHEVTHAAISHVLRNPNHPLTKQFVKFFDQIQDRLGAAYGAQDLQEFAAELVGNPEFQAVLKEIKAPRSESMFQNIMRSIAEFFGFQKNAFDAGLKFVNEAIDISHSIEANPADKMFLVGGNFSAVHEVGQAMPKLVGSAIEQTKNTISNLQEYGLAKVAFGLLRLDNLNTMYGKQLPSIQTLLDALELRNGTQERRIKDANTKYRAFEKVQKQYPQQMKRMDNIAIDARLAGVDILDPNFRPTASQQAAYSKLRTELQGLPPAVQGVYRTIRADYDSSLAQYRKILTDAASGVSPALAKRLAAQFQASKEVVGYVPFLRQGDFWVEYADPATGERTATAFESIRQRQQFIDQMLTPKKIAFKNHQNLQDIRFSGENLPPTSLIYQLINDLKKQNASQEQLDSVYQSYLTLFPGESIVKQFMKSQNVLGMDRDIIRGYGDMMVRWARKLANSEYIPQIDRAVSGVATEAQNANDSTLTAVAQNILDQSAFFHNPSYNKLVHTATAMSYFEYIAGNISSALVNLTSLPMMVWPMLTGKYGYGAASSAMLNAGKIATNDWGTMARYKNLYNSMMDHAQLEHTMAREVLEGRRQSTADFNSVKARIMDGISIPFAMTEKYNRATTAIAAYDLAKQGGMSEDAAIKYAITTVKDVHTSGLAATGPKWMQTPLGRMFFTFKSFVWNSAFIMARAFHQSFKGESPEIRKAAQRQLIGTVGMTAAFAGAKGLPFYGAASVLATMLNSLFGDDDEPFDFNEEMRHFFGELMYKGAFNYATNLELSNRAGIATDLLFRDDPRGIAEHGYVLSAMQQAFGPIGTIAVNSGNAFNMFKDGHIERAIETLAPGFVRNGMKGARYLTEGATTLKGDPVMEDINAYNSLMQVFGFGPADLSSTYEKVSAAKGYEREVNARRTKLLNLYDMAHQAGDTEMMQEAKDKISKFNTTIPAKRITPVTLQRSVTARKAAEKDMINGVRFDKKLRPEIQEKFFEE